MANRLKELRLKHNLTQEALAALVGTTKQTIGRLENGKRRLGEQWVRRIARALNEHPGELWQELPFAPTPRTLRLVEAFEMMDEDQQATFVHIADALAQQPPTVKTAEKKKKD